VFPNEIARSAPSSPGCASIDTFNTTVKTLSVSHHPGGNPGANLTSISNRCYLREAAFKWELTKETIHLPLGCLQDGVGIAWSAPSSPGCAASQRLVQGFYLTQNIFEVVLQNSIVIQIRQLILCINNSQGQVDGCVGKLISTSQRLVQGLRITGVPHS